MQETGTKLAEFCAHALLSLEVLIHPRALPLIDIGSSVEYPVNVNGMKDKFMKNNIYSSGVQKSNLVTVTGGTSRNEAESEEDDLYEKWVKDGENEIEKNTAENAVSIEATINVAKDKGKGILVETQSIEETDRNALKNMETEVEVAVAVAKGVSGGGAANDVAGRRFETVGGSEGGGQLVFAIGDNDNEDAAMDEIPDIVDVEPDSDEE